MVKASRRVKRIKRSKKQVHRARGRKTNHRRRRHTRRQTGGAIITVCKKKGFDAFGGTGIDITYDDATQLFKIGTQPTIEGLETFNGKKRYERAVFVLRQISAKPDPIQLNWYNFALFAPIYCHKYTDPQCEQMRVFLTTYSTSKDIDKNGAVEGRTIGTSINSGNEQAARNTYLTDIEVRFPAAAAASSAAAAAAPAAAASSAAEFDKTCVINSNQVSFLGTPFAWKDHNLPLEITTFEFAQKNKGLMYFLIANVDKFVFFKAKLTVRMKTAKTEKMYIETSDAIFLSIHFKKTRENDCALATFKGKDAFNLGQRIDDSTLKYPHFLLYPNNQPGTNDTTDQENVATCYIGKYADLPKGITYDDFVKVIDQFATYKTECKDLSAQMSALSTNP
jgi:hypothetical protein